jgi:hypothetical protein
MVDLAAPWTDVFDAAFRPDGKRQVHTTWSQFHVATKCLEVACGTTGSGGQSKVFRDDVGRFLHRSGPGGVLPVGRLDFSGAQGHEVLYFLLCDETTGVTLVLFT